MLDRRDFLGALGTAAGSGAAIGGLSRRGRGQERTNRRVIGTRNRRAAERAAERATELYHVLNLEERGWVVVGEFPTGRVSALDADSGVKYAARDPKVSAHDQGTPWGIERVGADTVTEAGYTGARVDVAVIDSGIDSDHPDLQANLGAGVAYLGSKAGPESWDDDDSHGTHCAGTIAAVNNSRGVVGVGVDIRLHAVKALDDSGSGYMSDIVAGIEWVADRGYHVASISLGGPDGHPTLEEACGYAYDRGVLLVSSAGNDGTADSVGYPAAYEEVIAVGATQSDDDLAYYSSRGPEVEIAAPGSDITSTVPGGYGQKQGTSMACPHVAAAGAHLMALGYPNAENRDDPSNPGGARGRLRETAMDIGLSSTQAGSGLLDLERSLAGADVPIGEAGTLTIDQSSGDYWQAVPFDRRYTDPVVLTGPVSKSGNQPVHTRLRNVTAGGFECQLEEWDYLDGSHVTERVGYVVIETGAHVLADGTRLEAGTAAFDDDGTRIEFNGSFDTTPVAFSTPQTRNGSDPIVTRQASVSTTGFGCRLQEGEARGGHTTESVGYLAIEPGRNDGPVAFEAGQIPESVRNDLTFGFDGGFDNAPVFLAALQTTNGNDTATLRQHALDENGATIAIEEETSDDAETSHTDEVAGYFAVGGDGPLYGGSAAMRAVGETGTVSLDQPDPDAWQQVSFENEYAEPVVITSPASKVGNQPVHTRLRDVTAGGFECQLEEWDYLDGTHTRETIDYLVVEAGVHTLADGTRLEAGTAAFDESGTRVQFSGSFNTTPVAFSTPQTRNGSDPIVTRQASVSTTGFDCRIQEAEARGSHTAESVGYLAIEPGQGRSQAAFEAGRRSGVDETGETITFDRSYDDPPATLCAMQTENGSDTAALRTLDRDRAGLSVAVEEETSDDDETHHATESVGYLAVAGDRLIAT